MDDRQLMIEMWLRVVLILTTALQRSSIDSILMHWLSMRSAMMLNLIYLMQRPTQSYCHRSLARRCSQFHRNYSHSVRPIGGCYRRADVDAIQTYFCIFEKWFDFMSMLLANWYKREMENYSVCECAYGVQLHVLCRSISYRMVQDEVCVCVSCPRDMYVWGMKMILVYYENVCLKPTKLQAWRSMRGYTIAFETLTLIVIGSLGVSQFNQIQLRISE